MSEIKLKDFSDYVDFINTWIVNQPKKGYGIKGEIAEFLGVNTSYLSQILSGSLKLTEEHAIRMAEYFNFNGIEADYFLALVAHDRAGTANLKKYYKGKLADLKTELNQVISQREESKKDGLDQYFSSWIYTAIHIALSIRPMTLEELADFCGFVPESLRPMVNFLHSHNFLIEKNGKFEHSKENVTLAKGNEHLKLHHNNWRLRGIEEIQKNNEDNLHYTSIISCSVADSLVIKEKIRELIAEIREIIKESKDEDVFCFTADCFKIFDSPQK